MILVTGATGNVGSELTRALLSAGEPVRALVRDAGARLPAGAERVVGDLGEPTGLGAALSGADGLFLMSGYPDAPGLLSAARQTGVQRVVLLSGGAAVAARTDNPISQYMLVTERAVQDSGLAWTILRPYEFMANALRWVPQAAANDVITVPFADVAVAVIDPHDIAAVAAAALLSDGHAGHSYRLSGPTALLPAERVEILGSALQRPLRAEAQPDEAAREEMLAGMPESYVDAFFDFYTGGGLDESAVLSTVQDVTGRPPRSFEQWAGAHAGAFR
jgi:uncharacterized protein YbjT (DUF2867 family)